MVNRKKKVETVTDFIFLGSKITADGDCSHVVRRCLLWQVTEAEDIKKRLQEYTEELYKKDLHDPDNHDGVITHLEPDIQECEVKWALGSITRKKASGGNEIPVDLFQILKDDSVKVLHSICQQIWKTQQ